MAKPSDMLPELQGRLPIRVVSWLAQQEDFRRMPDEPEGSWSSSKGVLATERSSSSSSRTPFEELPTRRPTSMSRTRNIGRAPLLPHGDGEV